MGASRADIAAQEGDEAFAWVMRYLKDFGAQGEPCSGPLLGRDADGELLIGPTRYAPDVPEAIDRVLALMGGDRIGGFNRLRLSPTTEMPFIKKEFVAAFVRGRRLA